MLKNQWNVMHVCKEFYISNDVIFTTNHILLMQSSTLCKNDVSFIKNSWRFQNCFHRT